MNLLSLVAQSGRCTDGVLDHASGLTKAMGDEGWRSELVVVDWRSEGFLRSLRKLRRRLRQTDADRVVVHYSHLAWSRRGFPFGFIALVAVLKSLGAEVFVWIHDPGRVGPRLHHRVMSFVKGRGLVLATWMSDGSVVSVHPTCIDWISRRTRNVIYCPSAPIVGHHPWRGSNSLPTVAVFGSAIGPLAKKAEAVTRVCTRLAQIVGQFELRLVGADDGSAALIADMLRGSGVQVRSTGHLDVEGIADALSSSTVLLVVREGLTPRSSTLSAALMCGLPVIGMTGDETCEPIFDAGTIIVDDSDWDAMAVAVGRVIADPVLAQELSERSHDVATDWFSWSATVRRVAGLFERVA